jgi:predicted metal-dependent hydrolase/CheY-like chemotaxis protein
MNTTQEQKPLIIGFVSDLMFAPRIANVVRHLNYDIKWIETPADFGAKPANLEAEPRGEPLHGQEGQLFEQITAWQPVLLLFDLNNNAIPWQRWIALLKSSAATRRIPVVCFGPHEDVEVMTAAKKAGADAVLARSRFTADLPQLIRQYAKQSNQNAITTACQEPLTDLAKQGIEKFNAGQYYKCHDDLEEAWNLDQTPGRDLYRGILQVGIALYQIERENYRGAVKMLLRVRQWLEPLPDTCRGVNVAKLRQNTQIIHEELLRLGEENLSQFIWTLVEPIEFS